MIQSISGVEDGLELFIYYFKPQVKHLSTFIFAHYFKHYPVLSDEYAKFWQFQLLIFFN